MMFDFIFSVVQEQRNLKPSPYIADLVAYLMALSNGATPAFAPAIDNSAAPISCFQNLFLEDYRLKKYHPTIMHMHHFSQQEKRPVYYSFQIPTTMLFSPRSNNALSTMTELRELKYITEVLMSEIQKGYLGVERTPFMDIANNVQFRFFHNEKDKSQEIEFANNLAAIDPAFMLTSGNDGIYSFPEHSPFFRGCVSITTKDEPSKQSG